jgi:hypothetical protein
MHLQHQWQAGKQINVAASGMVETAGARGTLPCALAFKGPVPAAGAAAAVLVLLLNRAGAVVQ